MSKTTAHSRRINVYFSTKYTELLKIVRLMAEKEERSESHMALLLIKEAVEAREKTAIDNQQ